MHDSILVVEDNVHDLEFTLLALDRCGFASMAKVARDGEEALEYLMHAGEHKRDTAGVPALVLLDVKLPKLDGHEVLDRIRACKGLRGVPVVLFSSSAEPSDLARGYRAGANAYVVKPVDSREYMSAVADTSRFWVAHNVRPMSYTRPAS